MDTRCAEWSNGGNLVFPASKFYRRRTVNFFKLLLLKIGYGNGI